MFSKALAFRRLLGRKSVNVKAFRSFRKRLVLLSNVTCRTGTSKSVSGISPSRAAPRTTIAFFRPSHRCTVSEPVALEGMHSSVIGHIHDQGIFSIIGVANRFRCVRAQTIPGRRGPCPHLVRTAHIRPRFRACSVRKATVNVCAPRLFSKITGKNFRYRFVDSSHGFNKRVLSCVISGTGYRVRAVRDVARRFTIRSSSFVSGRVNCRGLTRRVTRTRNW